MRAALALFDEGSTVPFVARYRRERTGGLDEVQLRQIADAHRQHVELQDRRSAILKALTEQGVLTDALRATIAACQTRSALEDAYAPYKKRRKTRADNAKEKGLEPLAELLLAQTRRGNPITDATSYVDPSKGVTSVDEALAGARDIVAETLASRPTLRSLVRQDVGDHGMLSSSATKKTEGADDFRDYADHTERAARVPSHRYLAMCRGEAEGVLTIKIRPDLERTLQQLLRAAKLDRGSPWAEQMRQATDDALRRLLLPAAERRVRAILKEHADDEAIEVFQRNLEALLLAAPLGGVSVLGIDPGIRTGCKCALVSETGALVEHQVLHLVGRKDPQTDRLAAWLSRARPAAVAVGNGTGGREALAAVRTALREAGMDVPAVSVSESGASIYSASELARQELPDVDLTVRSAAHIARRLQDPLAELVKVPPGSIGVGQYQHDVDDKKLTRKLSEVVESCVNRVGVDVNTASPALLAHVAGIGPKLAERIVAHRQANGAFRRRRDLLDVQGLGKKTFEQCAGFLRIRDGSEPLDASAVHPERYKLVARMARDLGCSVAELVGDAAKARTIQMDRYVDEDTGLQTLADIVGELTKPGRDPRQAFEAPAFRDDVQELSDVREGMVLHGVVTNVTNFGAFVDVGVHQDGLVHISQLADRYVSSPHEVVSAGQSVKVKVLEVDLDRRRISLSMKQA
ncbi:MAG: RNA-binding transcriptional accessory protein [Myxococcales bacterium]|nr:RNA-binding transcriptional accessory protein [Myxococcales bacterium]